MLGLVVAIMDGSACFMSLNPQPIVLLSLVRETKHSLVEGLDVVLGIFPLWRCLPLRGMRLSRRILDDLGCSIGGDDTLSSELPDSLALHGEMIFQRLPHLESLK